jgi:DNA-binding NarL/FixJ family response regulator
MPCRVLIVEDEIFVAIEVESVLQDLGCLPIGIAAESRTAMDLAKDAEIALVDLNLHDGPTGIDIGSKLAARGVTVMFMTANPAQLGDGVPGALGVLPKPVNSQELKSAIQYVIAVHKREHPVQVRPPRRLKLFDLPLGGLEAQPAG